MAIFNYRFFITYTKNYSTTIYNQFDNRATPKSKGAGRPSLAGAEMTELQDMFAANARPKTQEGGAGGPGKKKKNEKHSVLRDAQRGQNVVIGLAQFKVINKPIYALNHI